MARDYVVYVHQNKINGKRYIGVTNNTSKRWCSSGARYEGCPHFWSAIQKYGWDNFYHVVIVSGLTLEEANVLEQYYIAIYDTYNSEKGYNATRGGINAPTMLGKHHSEETKRKIGDANRGKTISEAQRQAHSQWMSEHFVGKRNHKSRAVRCINTGEIFESQRQAAEAKGVLQPKIWKCCSGEANHVHGLKWEYVDEVV